MVNNEVKTKVKLSKVLHSKTIREIIGQSPLSPLDISRIAELYEIDYNAEILAKKELPASDDPVKIDQEKQIEQIYQDAVTEYYSYVNPNIINDDNTIQSTRHEIDRCLSDYEVAVSNYKLNNADIATDELSELKKQHSDYKKASASYHRFTEENKLERPAQIRGTIAKAVSVSILIIIIIFEGACNASFFAQNLEGGLAFGFIYAGLLALINALVCFFISRKLIIQINHVKLYRKLFGYLFIIISLIFIVVLGNLIGQLRDAMGVYEESSEWINAVKNNIINHDFLLKDLSSWILFALTIISGIVALVDGYTYDDPYPGYADEEIKFLKSKEKWSDYYSYLKSGYEEKKDEVLNSIRESLGRASNALDTVKKTSLEKQNLLVAYENSRLTAEKAVISLIQRFRSKNMQYRRTPPPKYFNEDINELDLSNIPKIVTPSREDDEKLIKSLEEKVEIKKGEFTKITFEIMEEYQSQLDKFVEIIGEADGS